VASSWKIIYAKTADFMWTTSVWPAQPVLPVMSARLAISELTRTALNVQHVLALSASSAPLEDVPSARPITLFGRASARAAFS
jgi:hypothetical protein